MLAQTLKREEGKVVHRTKRNKKKVITKKGKEKTVTHGQKPAGYKTRLLFKYIHTKLKAHYNKDLEYRL